MSENLHALLGDIRACQLCRADMARLPNPVLQVSGTARILIAGQAPGNLADRSGIPFTDPSGVRLRDWLGVSQGEFYDPASVAIVPMGFCFPGYDAKGSDRPPFARCAATWRGRLLEQVSGIRLTVLVGKYAQAWHLGPRAGVTVAATVARWTEFAKDGIFVLPHPSWRNTAWLKRHPWFEIDLLPHLRAQVRACLSLSPAPSACLPRA